MVAGDGDVVAVLVVEVVLEFFWVGAYEVNFVELADFVVFVVGEKVEVV